MKISRFRICRFRLPLKEPLTINKKSLKERAGLLVELTNEQGCVAIGETSPLIGFSPENEQLAQRQLRRLRAEVDGSRIPEDLEVLCGGFDGWLGGFGLAPSVRFGFETAVLGLSAATKGLALPTLLCNKPSAVVCVNGLLAGTRQAVIAKAERLLAAGFRAFKLKVGRYALDKDVDLVRQLRDLIGHDAVLRLDANRAWNVEQTLAFARRLEGTPVDYLEEPVGSVEMLVSLLQEPAMSLPVALDESLVNMAPEDLASWSKIKAVVLKPTLLGFEKTIRFARTAMHLGMTPVVSSAFESGVGVTILAQIASSINQGKVPAGLDTLDRFAEDLLQTPLTIEHGELTVPALPNTVEGLKGKLVQIVDDA